MDFTAIACLLLEDPRSPAARRSLATDDEWVSATIWRQQFLDLLTGHVRSGWIVVASALQKLAAADFMLRNAHEILPDQEVFELSQDHELSASQVTYVLTAKKTWIKASYGRQSNC